MFELWRSDNWNNWNEVIKVKLVPYSVIFSGWNNEFGNAQRYTFSPCSRMANTGTNWSFIFGGIGPNMDISGNFNNCSKGYTIFEFDDGSNYRSNYPQFVGGAFGYGLWKLEFYNVYDQLITYCYLDYRDYRFSNGCSGLAIDLEINLEDDLRDGELEFRFGNWIDDDNISATAWVSINDLRVPNRTIQWWRQVGNPTLNQITECPNGLVKGTFKSSNQSNGLFLNWPISATDLIGNVGHVNDNILNMNLTLDINHYAQILSNKDFKVSDNSTLKLLSGSTVTVLNYATLTLDHSTIDLSTTTSNVIVKPYGKLCSYGGRVNGSGNIYFEGKTRCIGWQDWVISDSTKIELQDSASWQLDSGSVITLEGNETKLILNPNSEIKFGKDSKLILRNGARLIANNATFTYLDSSNKSWDGIYLYDKAIDTLINCTIENAVNGINIIKRELNIFYSC